MGVCGRVGKKVRICSSINYGIKKILLIIAYLSSCEDQLQVRIHLHMCSCSHHQNSYNYVHSQQYFVHIR